MPDATENEIKAAGPNGRVVPSHSTSVDRTSAWDRTAQFRKMRSPASPAYFNDLFAFQLPNTKGDRKTHYTFIHHFVGENGEPGAASGRALANSVAVLNGGRQGTVLRGAARQGVYNHIAKHYRDADMEVPELKSDEDVDALMMFKGLIEAPLSETLDLTIKGMQDLDNIIDEEVEVSWVEDDTEFKGIVSVVEDDSALVEMLDEKGERTGEFYELEYAEIKLRTFVVMEKIDGDAETGTIVSWETSQGRYYGDVVSVETSGKVRGEPQGLEIEGSEENPAYLVRVWMMEAPEGEMMDEDEAEDEEMPAKSRKSDSEWTPTNVTIVARGDALKVEEALPTGASEDDYDNGSEDEETPMKSIDQELSAKIEKVLKENSEILERLAQFDAEEKAAEVADEETQEVEISDTVEEGSSEEVKSEDAPAETEEIIEEAKSDETTEAAAEAADEVESKSDEVESKSDEQAAEDVVEEAAEETAEETAEESAEAPVVEEKASISLSELKEFNDLLKTLAD